MQTRYKFLRTGYKSENGNHKWQVGKWYEFKGDIEMCNAGFHCSKGIYQAFSYVQGEILTQVEVKGKHQSEDDKEVWEQMRVIKSWKWTKKDSVLFAIYAASLVLDIFEKEFPNDDRPRKAIEAAETYVKYPTSKNRDAAGAAWAAARAAWAAGDAGAAGDAARAAAGAAGDAAGAAGDAAGAAWAAGDAEAAGDAARAAAWAARAAAWAAGDAAGAAWAAARAARAAGAALYKELDKWMLNHIINLKVIRSI